MHVYYFYTTNIYICSLWQRIDLKRMKGIVNRAENTG